MRNRSFSGATFAAILLAALLVCSTANATANLSLIVAGPDPTEPVTVEIEAPDGTTQTVTLDEARAVVQPEGPPGTYRVTFHDRRGHRDRRSAGSRVRAGGGHLSAGRRRREDHRRRARTHREHHGHRATGRRTAAEGPGGDHRHDLQGHREPAHHQRPAARPRHPEPVDGEEHQLLERQPRRHPRHR